MKDFIINLLDIEEKDVDDMRFDYQGDKLYIIILFKQKYHRCPRCLRNTQSIKDYSLKTLAHQVINHRLTFIQYNCRRYISLIATRHFMKIRLLVKRIQVSLTQHLYLFLKI